MVSALAPLLALAATAAALQVTSPTKSDVWKVGESQTVTWDSVSSDQESFNIYLSNMASYPTTSILLASDVSSSDGSAKIDGSKLTTGNSFTINFTNGTETEQIYAQSNQFNITEGSSSSSSSSASSTAASSTSTGTATASSTLVKTTASSSAGSGEATSTSANSSTGSSTATATDASSTASSTGAASSGSAASGTKSGSGAASTSTSTTTSGAGQIMAGWMGVIAVAVLAL